ncbi:MAG: mercury(II) reductase [Actinomycetota bacterium]|nr:mercury(II) reductase [Actinomycetota bacterium]
MSEANPVNFDLAVIGSGGGAFAAAIRATNLGKRVLMVERGTIGGMCVNTGCVPSKALLAAAEARHVALDSGRFPGIVSSAGPVEMEMLIGGKRDLVKTMRAVKYVDLIADYGWDLRRGDAAFAGTGDGPVLNITGDGGSVETVHADQYLVATGSAPWAPPIVGLAEAGYLTSTTAMELNEVPESPLVLGGGYVALEQAQLFSRLGSRVTVLARSRLASREEPEAARALMGVFADEGIRVIRRAAVSSVRRDEGKGDVVAVVVTAGGKEEARARRLLVATGRRPVTDSLNLGAVGVAVGKNGELVVNDMLTSSNPRIWAAGDVTGHREFVYVAASHGALVVENAFNGAGRAVDYRYLPRVTFTSPALAAAGMTEEEANAAGIPCECRVLPLEYVPRALVNRDTRGFIKVVADSRTGLIVGISAVAKDAGEIAASGVYILAAGMTVAQVATMWSPYLTLAEGIRIACQSYSTKVSKLSCCAASARSTWAQVLEEGRTPVKTTGFSCVCGKIRRTRCRHGCGR